ncbi:hypothetical protein V1478_012587 [Vespula squamosa]|uniref:Uncharacterized protein n=1 Tax=Vespula squamosa TaxID=30214 RepID=A0ABD2ADM8_VESSQ
MASQRCCADRGFNFALLRVNRAVVGQSTKLYNSNATLAPFLSVCRLVFLSNNEVALVLFFSCCYRDTCVHQNR